jgi:hypothetical protein
VLCYSVHILSFEKKYLRSTIEYLVYKIFRETIPLKEKRWTFLRDRTDILVRDFLCAERTPAFLTLVRRMHIFCQRHGCNRVQGGGDWPHPILGVLQPDEKIGILRFENCTFKYTCLDCSGGELISEKCSNFSRRFASVSAIFMKGNYTYTFYSAFTCEQPISLFLQHVLCTV